MDCTEVQPSLFCPALAALGSQQLQSLSFVPQFSKEQVKHLPPLREKDELKPQGVNSCGLEPMIP